MSWGNFAETVLDITYYTVFGNDILENTATSSRGQWVKDRGRSSASIDKLHYYSVCN